MYTVGTYGMVWGYINALKSVSYKYMKNIKWIVVRN